MITNQMTNEKKLKIAKNEGYTLANRIKKPNTIQSFIQKITQLLIYKDSDQVITAMLQLLSIAKMGSLTLENYIADEEKNDHYIVIMLNTALQSKLIEEYKKEEEKKEMEQIEQKKGK